MKTCFNAGEDAPFYFWRDSQGHEVDLLIENGEKLFPIEIKSGQTIASSMFSGLNYWQKLSQCDGGMLIYSGSNSYTRNGMQVRSWMEI